MAECAEHEIRVAVLVKAARCPTCGPRLYADCDACGKRFVYPVVADRDEFAVENRCECGEVVLIEMEPWLTP